MQTVCPPSGISALIEVNEFYSLPGEVPVTVAINQAGEIVDRENGSSEKARFEELMKKAMGL